MTPEQERAEFEAWAMYKADLQKGPAGEYVDIFARVMLDAWRAALASPEAQALSKDAERLDWIENQAKESRSGISIDWRSAYSEESRILEPKGWRVMRHRFLGDRKPSIREAIDAAVRALKKDQS